MRLVGLSIGLFVAVAFAVSTEFEPPSDEWKIILQEKPSLSVHVRGIDKVGQQLPSLYA
ncbi:MAG: hypothetical protein GXO48_07105, partial [Chlorobi bacterium]|nr:hypothetical protein [Chlorobiota bacterium]